MMNIQMRNKMYIKLIQLKNLPTSTLSLPLNVDPNLFENLKTFFREY